MNYKFVLVNSESGEDKAEWIVRLPVTVGRCPTADITIGDASISRRHCEFFVDPHGSLSVHDLGSKNGVFVDERKVEKAVVRPGTTVRMGMITLRPELTDEEMNDSEDLAEVFDLDVDETQAMKIVRPGAQADHPPDDVGST